uniref:Syntaxin-18 n=1 Tax=Pavo cristatus TaxID=9049 RepID=A0A8C9EME2_PAVCR
MAVDITLLFKASVKTVKTRNKALGVAAGDSARDELLKRSAARSRSDFTGRAREVISNIGKLKDFLLQHRKDYINAYRSVLCFNISVNEKHYLTVLSELRNNEKCLLLHCSLSCIVSNSGSVTDRNLPDAQSNLGLWGDGKGEDELSPEEIQMFEQENQRLVGEMNNLFDEVRQIEGKVVEISRLQEIFTEKVLQQETDIDNIHQLVVGATENIKEGNEDIREAIKNNAGFRVWILFFLVMCSFSLLFLDWYDN